MMGKCTAWGRQKVSSIMQAIIKSNLNIREKNSSYAGCLRYLPGILLRYCIILHLYCIYITCNINIYHIHFAYIVKKVLSQNDLRHLPCREGSLLLNLYPRLPAKTVRSITPACANCFIALDTVGMEIWQAMAISFSCSKSLCTISPWPCLTLQAYPSSSAMINRKSRTTIAALLKDCRPASARDDSTGLPS